MKVLVSGGTGLVGRYIVGGLQAAGYKVVIGGRSPPPPDLFGKPVAFVPLFLDPDLEQLGAFDDVSYYVHAAFDHVPGRYRGGEGDDPGRFRRLNLMGSVKLFETARQAGIKRVVFLSSRAVYDGLPTGTNLTEELELSPTTLYGQVKLEAEKALASFSAPGFITASLRLTGVYGELRPNKWDQLFSDFLSGKAIEPRAGTEVHGRDVAAGVRLMLEREGPDVNGQSFNLSDVTTETLEILQHLHHPAGRLPPQVGIRSVNAMPTTRIRRLGWRPGGQPLLARTIQVLADGLNAPA